MLQREIQTHLKRLAKKYPVITITGPRQSGKTTLVKATFPQKIYQSLENPDIRLIAEQDPIRFLNRFPKGAILDEIQRVPHLLSYIQTIVDESNRSGMFILTGSAQFELMHNLNQSLAGRSAIVRLLPLAFNELPNNIQTKITLDDLIYRGFYPRIYDKKLNPTETLSFYVNTYIERDVRTLLGVKDLSRFEIFLRLCAARTGQILNLSNIGNECGVNHNTIAHWISILEASYILFRIRPHYQNFSKRLIKAPKIYFYDTGLVCYLLGIRNKEHVASHPLRGQLFENLVVVDILKKLYNNVKDNNLYYFRDNVGNEVDLILDYSDKVFPIEIKSTETFAKDMNKGLVYYQSINKKLLTKPCLVYAGKTSFEQESTNVVAFKNLNLIYNNLLGKLSTHK